MVYFMIILIFDKLQVISAGLLQLTAGPVMCATVRSQYSSKVVSGTIWWSVKMKITATFQS